MARAYGENYDLPYGGHNYGKQDRTTDCLHGCGCWMGSTMSGGPTGLDPFGECPNNPTDRPRLEGDRDYHCVVERRISGLEKRAHDVVERARQAEALLQAVEPGAVVLAQELATMRQAVAEVKSGLQSLSENAAKIGQP